MSERDDAPPGEAVEAMHRHIVRNLWAADKQRITATDALNACRTLPDAARWRLIGWLAAGLEPTEAMVKGAREAGGGYRGKITGALAAAREAGDGS